MYIFIWMYMWKHWKGRKFSSSRFMRIIPSPLIRCPSCAEMLFLFSQFCLFVFFLAMVRTKRRIERGRGKEKEKKKRKEVQKDGLAGKQTKDPTTTSIGLHSYVLYPLGYALKKWVARFFLNYIFIWVKLLRQRTRTRTRTRTVIRVRKRTRKEGNTRK